MSSKKIPSPNADHLIIYLDESINSLKQMEVEGQYETAASDSTSVQISNSTNKNFGQFQNEWKSYFSNIPANFKVFHNIDDCHQCIIENSNTKTIFLVISHSIAEKILKKLIEKHNSMKKIYIIDGCITKYINWISQYYQENIDIILFDSYKELSIRILKDISEHYLFKGKNHKEFISSSDNSTLIYFDWAKQITFRAKQITSDHFQDQINNIEKSKNEAENFIKQIIPNFNIEQQIRNYQLEQDSDSVAIIFIVGLEIQLIDLASDVAKLLTCTNNDQLISTINNLKLLTPIIVVSSSLPSDDLLSLNQLLYYYSFNKSNQKSTTNYSKFSYVLSTEHLLNQLNHKLAQYYRDSAIQASTISKDQKKAKRLLERSKKCYQLLQNHTEKTLKRYAEILEKKKT